MEGVIEWFMAYYAEAKATYGTKGTDVGKRGQMLEGICRAGEIFFVPSGWWHSTSSFPLFSRLY
jgi:L-amino acid N-acyltransferase YncA